MAWFSRFLFSLCVLTAIKLQAADQPLIIRDANVFDSTAKKMVPGQTVTIVGDRISAVNDNASAKLPDDARVIDGTGKYIIPGLIDAHVHLTFPICRAQVTGDEILPLYLIAGVTTLRSTGDDVVAAAGVAHFAIAHPDICPSVFTASVLFDTSPPTHPEICIAVTDPSKVSSIVETMCKWHVTTLKIYARLSPEVAREVIRQGHSHGLMVTAHLADAYTADDAIADGIDCLEHITTVFDYGQYPQKGFENASREEKRANLDLNNPRLQTLIAALAQRQVMLCPTLTVFRNMLLLPDTEEVHSNSDSENIPKRLISHWQDYEQKIAPPSTSLELRRKEFAKYQQLTGLLYRAGVPLLVGTDSPEPNCPPGWALHQEMELLVQSGMKPVDVLVAATNQNARALKMEKNLGSIAPGKLADLVICDADPTIDITNARKINAVIHNGVLCDLKKASECVPRD